MKFLHLFFLLLVSSTGILHALTQNQARCAMGYLLLSPNQSVEPTALRESLTRTLSDLEGRDHNLIVADMRSMLESSLLFNDEDKQVFRLVLAGRSSPEIMQATGFTRSKVTIIFRRVAIKMGHQFMDQQEPGFTTPLPPEGPALREWLVNELRKRNLLLDEFGLQKGFGRTWIEELRKVLRNEPPNEKYRKAAIAAVYEAFKHQREPVRANSIEHREGESATEWMKAEFGRLKISPGDLANAGYISEKELGLLAADLKGDPDDSVGLVQLRARVIKTMGPFIRAARDYDNLCIPRPQESAQLWWQRETAARFGEGPIELPIEVANEVFPGDARILSTVFRERTFPRPPNPRTIYILSNFLRKHPKSGQ